MERTLLLFLLEITAKATTIVGATALVCWVLRRASAAVRHFTWTIALAGVLALPALALLMPDWRIALLPAAPSDPAVVSRQTATPPTGVAPNVARNAEPVVPLAEARPQRSRAGAPERAEATVTPPRSFTPSDPEASRSDHAIEGRRVDGRAIADRPISRSHHPITRIFDRRMAGLLFLAFWIAGAMVALGRFVAGHARLWRMERHADAITDPAWLELAQRVAEQLRLTAPKRDGVRCRSAVRLLRCRRPAMPVCWGVRQPSLLLPSDADSWTVERRRIVLLHELAHAKRRDYLTQALAQMAIAMHWFNPLVWLAVGHLRVERERACDDLVLASGANAPDYADHLLDIARAFRTAGCPSWAAVAMARPSQLEGRLLAILDRHRDRRALTRPACAGAALMALAMFGALAAVRPAPASAASDAQSSSRAVSTISAHAAQADAPGTTTAELLPGDSKPVPVRPPRPKIAAEFDLREPIELDDLEIEDRAGRGTGIGKGAGIGVGGGVPGGIPQIGPVEIEVSGPDAVLSLDWKALAAQTAGTRIARTAPADDRPAADPKIVAALVTALKDQSADVRREAAATLAGLRSPQALDALVAATTDLDRNVREFAVRAISRQRSDAVTQALVRALKDDDPGVRRSAMLGVARLRDPKYIDLFIDALKSADPEVRTLAIHALSGFRDARAVPGLMTALADANAEVRQYAAHALGQIGDARAVDPLIAALKDSDGDVRGMAVYALGQIGRRADARGRK
jgi:beta-lactamase regulating signal transducer with metallopeptidase domain